MNKIILENVSKSFDREILKNINLTINKNGLYLISGESGSGKTTLLNAIGGLSNFDGKICINEKDISNLVEDELDDFRFKNIGYVFQDFRLIENETVFENISLPYQSLSFSHEEVVSKVNDALNIVGLNKKSNQIVSFLSGGEKQRVAIARAIINDPCLLLCDEPTGALDSENAIKIMEILKIISRSMIVIIVSHDLSLCEKFVDKVFMLKKGHMSTSKSNSNKNLDKNLLIRKRKNKANNIHVPFSFLLKHTFHNFKLKKVRTFLSMLISSLGLLSIGLSFTLSSIISTNIKSTYSMLLGEEKIVVKNKNTMDSFSMVAGDKEIALEIASNYPSFIKGIGYCYIAEFETFFSDMNELDLVDDLHHHSVGSYSVRNINDFEWLENCKEEIYPSNKKSLKDDEIIISLNQFSLSDLCSNLYISKSVESLSNYLLGNKIKVAFELENNDWDYSDEQIFSIVGFTIESTPRIYHSNHFWNEVILEENMRFPVSNNLSEKDYYPWVMKKIPFLYSDDIETFLNVIYEDERYKDFLFDLGSELYYPLLNKNKNLEDIHRLMFFISPYTSFKLSDIKYLKKCNTKLDKYYIGSDLGYSIYPEAFMMGFNQTLLASFDDSLLEETIDTITSIDLDISLSNIDGILSSNFLCSNLSNFIFSVDEKDFLNGNKPKNINEISVSNEFLNKIGKGNTKVGDVIYFSYPFKNVKDKKGNIRNIYNTVECTISGIYDSKISSISSSSNWLINFFLLKVGISAFNLYAKNIAFSGNNFKNEEIMDLKLNFPKFEFYNPYDLIDDSLGSVTNFLEVILSFLSIISIVISIILSIYSSLIDMKCFEKELGALRCLGFKKRQTLLFFNFNIIILSLFSFLFSILELCLISLVSSFELNGFISLLIDPYSFIFMFLLLIPLTIVPILLVNIKLKKKDPLSIYNAFQ